MAKKIGILLVVFIGFLIAVSAVKFKHYLSTPAKKGGGVTTIVVKHGSAFNSVVDLLLTKGIIKEKIPFVLWARFMGYDKDIRAGEYRLSSGMSPVEIMKILTSGDVFLPSVTVPEGFTIKQIGRLLEKKGITKGNEFYVLAHNPELVRYYHLSAPSLEGFLYPDTYKFHKGTSPRLVIDVMVHHFFDKVAPFEKEIKKTGMTLEQVVTLASIVEKETACEKERPIIAGVFLNRLKRGMRLESDPTVIYGINDFNGNITKHDLLKHTPYNTYVIKGLPYGPISNPGIESIKAVIFPAHTNYLYFVSKNNGSHYFSKSFSEHKRAVYRYQKRHRRKRSR